MTASRCLIPCWRIQAPLRSPKAWLPSPAVLLSPAVLSLLIVTLPTCLWHSSVSSTFADEGTLKEDGTAKEIVLVAGSRSHGFGSHEHYAGLRILQDALQKSDDNLKVSLSKGWPKPKMLERADTVVIYCDGGKRHVAMDHRAELKSLLAEGCGLVCLHYAVEMVPGQSGDDWVEMLGGHFEVNYSVNPHWDADFTLLPTHPITYGVEPFQANDEWYFHMRFSDAGKLTPILSAVAPESTMRRKDGPHSGNPHVRKSVAAGEPQTVAWAYERPDCGRSFGFTGGHFHWNWGNDNIRRLVTNAIRWTAGADIEMDGSDLGDKIGIESLLQNQDYDPPKNFDEREIAERFELLSQPRRSSRESARAVKLVATPVEQPSTAESDPRDPKNAVAGIEVADGLELTLSASEPLLKSLTNLDIDSRGRVWVCDVMNYRRNQGSRPEGDRILILE
ncbi:MAG: ThuA domain-containing protein, partial [Planctomycetota bacterium]